MDLQQQSGPGGAHADEAPDDPWADHLHKLARGEVEDYLLGSLFWSAVRWREMPEIYNRAFEVYRTLVGRRYDQGRAGFDHLPLSLVVDLVSLIERGDQTLFASELHASDWLPGERLLRTGYENRFLGALLQERAFQAARERLPLAREVRRGAIVHLVALLMQHFAPLWPERVEVEPAHLRELALAPAARLEAQPRLARFLDTVDDETFFETAMAQFLAGLNSEVAWHELLRSEDLFEIEHWEVLDTEAERIGVRQIGEVERRLGEARLPRIYVNDEAFEAETDLIDETEYPTGGLAGLTNRGSFENLVRSELVYMVAEAGGTNLFDVRYIESELLYYMRDDGVMRRKRRIIHLVLDVEAGFFAKSPGYDYPFSTLSQGLVVRLCRDLLQTFQEDAVTLHVHYLWEPPADIGTNTAARREQERLQEEIELMRLVLTPEIKAEAITVDWVKELDDDSLQGERGRLYAVALCFGEARTRQWRERFEALEYDRPPVFGLAVPVGVDRPRQPEFEDGGELYLPAEGLPFGRFADLKNELYGRLLGLRRM